MNLLLIFVTLLLSTNSQNQNDRVDLLFKEFIKPNSAGVVVGVIQNGKYIHEKGYGYGSIEYEIPLSSKMTLGMASLSKQFTAMGIALLEEEGKLKVNDDIRKYIPEMPDYGHKIEIQHLIHHTSGIRSYTEMAAMAGEGLNYTNNLKVVFM